MGMGKAPVEQRAALPATLLFVDVWGTGEHG